MPHSCAAWNCTNWFTLETRSQGITFHRFPKNKELRKKWETAVRRDGFSASQSSVLCSELFRPEGFDRTGQTVRIRDGAFPSVFSFPSHLHRKHLATRTSQTSKKAQETLSPYCSQLVQETKPLPVPSVDHSYALPSSYDDLRARLREAVNRVERLEKERRNANCF
ncbi:THAP domain-containing protein 2-like [Chaetodon trifascialis]|uniref:THAP domain-containing protein 2-like n=1 Tax=Chaetodon trifascialis TaxID=109706 RepID=UPI0039924045